MTIGVLLPAPFDGEERLTAVSSRFIGVALVLLTDPELLGLDETRRLGLPANDESTAVDDS